MTGRESHPSTRKSSSLHRETERLAFSSSSSSTSKAHDPFWVPAFHVVNFKSVAREDRNGNEDDYEGCGFLQQSAKKRRLSPRQVQFLERSFDEENKLEAEKKAQLAKELGLQPRQVAIWFQNRRARFKTKQLEKEYGELKESYDKLRAECDRFLKEKELLKEEVLSLKDKLLVREKRKETQDSSDPLEDQKPNITIPRPKLGCKQEETATASRNCGVLDSGSPHFSNQQQPLLLEPAGSSHVFEPDCSDFSQEEGGNLGFPGLEPSCSLGFTAELDHHLLSWPY